MQNLDQIRAAQALAAADKTSKQAVSKLPAMIMTNGLLASTAFACEKNDRGEPKRKTMKEAMEAVITHLRFPIHGIAILSGCPTADEMIKRLSAGSGQILATSLDLQRATAEALSFLSYLKRFATKEEKED